MKIKRFTTMALVPLAIFLVILIGASDIEALQQGPSAKGGSFSRTRIDDSGSSRSRKESRARTDDPERSRRVVESLNLNFDFLAAEYKNAQKKAPALRFENAVEAALAAASQRPLAGDETTHTLMVEMAKKKTLIEALQIVLHLSEAQAEVVANEAALKLLRTKKQTEHYRR